MTNQTQPAQGEVVCSPLYSVKEELANSISHGIGVIASIVGLILLLLPLQVPQQSALEALKFSSFSIYGTTLILLFMASSIYHGLNNEKLKERAKLADHCAIYLLIAGSYTPLLLISTSSTLAHSMLWLIWCIALVGISFKLKFGSRFEKVSLLSYLAMGWCSLLIIYELWQNLPSGGFYLLVAGGIIYSLGTVFYSNDKIPYNHAIWHVFVLGGALCHYLMMLLYVLPM
ncbi:MAG: hemolysin III [Alteromonadaceae bacterium]|jgi:hemolysin III